MPLHITSPLKTSTTSLLRAGPRLNSGPQRIATRFAPRTQSSNATRQSQSDILSSQTATRPYGYSRFRPSQNNTLSEWQGKQHAPSSTPVAHSNISVASFTHPSPHSGYTINIKRTHAPCPPAVAPVYSPSFFALGPVKRRAASPPLTPVRVKHHAPSSTALTVKHNTLSTASIAPFRRHSPSGFTPPPVKHHAPSLYSAGTVQHHAPSLDSASTVQHHALTDEDVKTLIAPPTEVEPSDFKYSRSKQDHLWNRECREREAPAFRQAVNLAADQLYKSLLERHERAGAAQTQAIKEADARRTAARHPNDATRSEEDRELQVAAILQAPAVRKPKDLFWNPMAIRSLAPPQTLTSTHGSSATRHDTSDCKSLLAQFPLPHALSPSARRTSTHSSSATDDISAMLNFGKQPTFTSTTTDEDLVYHRDAPLASFDSGSSISTSIMDAMSDQEFTDFTGTFVSTTSQSDQEFTDFTETFIIAPSETGASIITSDMDSEGYDGGDEDQDTTVASVGYEGGDEDQDTTVDMVGYEGGDEDEQSLEIEDPSFSQLSIEQFPTPIVASSSPVQVVPGAWVEDDAPASITSKILVAVGLVAAATAWWLS